MERTQVDSSNLIAIGYDEGTQTLEIEFLGGRVYQYFDVPLRTYEELMGADSHGQYFALNVRNAFRYARQ